MIFKKIKIYFFDKNKKNELTIGLVNVNTYLLDKKICNPGGCRGAGGSKMMTFNLLPAPLSIGTEGCSLPNFRHTGSH
jgi:hypothetical protein